MQPSFACTVLIETVATKIVNIYCLYERLFSSDSYTEWLGIVTGCLLFEGLEDKLWKGLCKAR